MCEKECEREELREELRAIQQNGPSVLKGGCFKTLGVCGFYFLYWSQGVLERLGGQFRFNLGQINFFPQVS